MITLLVNSSIQRIGKRNLDQQDLDDLPLPPVELLE